MPTSDSQDYLEWNLFTLCVITVRAGENLHRQTEGRQGFEDSQAVLA